MLFDFLKSFFVQIRLVDLIDIGLISFLFYRMFLFLQGTRAMQMLTGMALIGVVYFLSASFELFTTHWVLSHFFDYFILIVVVLFQDDLRRAFTFIGKNPFSHFSEEVSEDRLIQEVTQASWELSEKHYGALIVIEREASLKNFIDTGSYLNSRLSSELLYSIFQPQSPLHDGAVILSDHRLAAASCFLPLSKDPRLESHYGSRHRAALGISEETDAIVVLVSEEKGAVHLVKNGKITENLTFQELRESLTALFEMEQSGIYVPKKFRGWMGISVK